MHNALGAYIHCGLTFAAARNANDAAAVAVEERHLIRMLETEAPDCRPFARAAFNDAYQSARAT
jgi:hypothetical protein